MDKINRTLLETEQVIPLFGQYLIKDILLKEVLGNEHETILYWLGKSLARKFRAGTVEEVVAFFNKAGWGQLSIEKEGKEEASFELVSPYHKQRIPHCYQLEAGFLAEQIQSQKKCISEAIVTNKRTKAIFSVKWDPLDIITE